jgi:ATP-binding cassette subfamily B protein
MIALIKRLIDVSGEYKGKIHLAFIFSFVKAFLSKTPIVMAFIAINGFYEGTMTLSICLWLGIAMIACLILQAVMDIFANKFQSTNSGIYGLCKKTH